MTLYCYLNGKIIPLKKAGIDLYDVGLLRGFGVFDVLRTYNGRPFLIKEHLSRFEESSKILGLKAPLPQRKIAEIIKKLLHKNGISRKREAVIRIILTGGKTRDGLSYDIKTPTLFILVEKFINLPAHFYTNGIKLITHDYQREYPLAKTLNYIPALKLQSIRQKSGAFEILYVHNDKALEGTTSNFFIFKKNNLITPKENILLGVTRNSVIKIARKKFNVKEENIPLSLLNSADEAFITATNKDIVPVIKINDKIVGSGRVGKNTKYLMALFREYIKRY